MLRTAVLGVLLATVPALLPAPSAFAAEADPFAASDNLQTTVPVGNGPRDTTNIAVVSWRDWPFQTTKRQAYDFSCGSATVATMMSYVYDVPTSERDVFKSMFDQGDQEKIRREGFSMLDMVNYMRRKGMNANGYKLSLAAIEKKRVPFIALINKEGYNHFVVVKGIAGPFVLVGDPNNGNVVYHRKHFEQMWNGIALLVTNHASKAHTVFNSPREWKLVRSLATLRENNLEQLIDSDVLEPMPWQAAPAGTDLFTTTMDTIESVRLGGGL
ncbi:MAG: peptidase C39 [Alphaproteobacteria bacterium]|nr:peptidase C39 [Alphaproteobacteria bacterium]